MRSTLLLIPFLLFACSKNEPPKPAVTVDMPEVSMHYDESHQFVLNQGSVRVQTSDYTWTHSNTDAGTISTEGLFTAKHIGETLIKGTSKTNTSDVINAKVTVMPYYTTWKKVITDWGFNKASVKLAETRSLLSDDATGLTYYGENDKVRGVIYLFDSNKLNSVGVLPENTSAVAKETATFLKERYDYLGAQNEIYLFSDNKLFSIALTVDSKLGLLAVYIPYKKGGRIATEISNRINTAKIKTTRNVTSSKYADISKVLNEVIK